MPIRAPFVADSITRSTNVSVMRMGERDKNPRGPEAFVLILVSGNDVGTLLGRG
jgi:hypothetical protein